MGKDDEGRFVFPLTSLQIGDLQSYLSDLSLFMALESNKFYILVDNRPWLKDLHSRPAHLWQLMVTKSRSSPFANTKGRRERKARKEASSTASTAESKKFERWFSLIDAATLSKKRVLLPVKKLRNSLLLSSELYGFIVFEVTWSKVRGINYLNELQTDTSLAIEAKFMRRWEFDSIAQAVGCLSSWFSGTLYEKHHLKEYLDSAIGEVFYDAEEDFPRTVPIDDDNESSFRVYPVSMEDETETDMPHTPPPTGPYKRRKVTKAVKNGVEVDVYCEERQIQVEDTLMNYSEIAEHENAVEPTHYRDVLILFRFDDRDLPFKLKQIIMSDLRLLTLLEAGLPSWVLFLQSYPGFCHIYRPWMCPLARALYVLISIVTVIIGFYDLYKNVPVLKATASRLCGPLFDWIETWEMVSRIKYLGTMLFLHNFQKAVKWFLMVTHATRSFFSYFTPLTEPVMEFLEFFVPLWTMLSKMAESSFSVIWIMIESSFNLVEDLIKVILQPVWLILTTLWNIAITILYPIFWILWKILYAPIRLVLALADSVAFVFACTTDFIGDIWRSLSTIFRVASATEATVSSYEVSMWRSLWNDLFSQVFRAVRSILNGFVAFFAACNRHRLSIYNHVHDFIKRLIRGQQSQASDPSSGSTPEGHYPSEIGGKVYAK